MKCKKILFFLATGLIFWLECSCSILAQGQIEHITIFPERLDLIEISQPVFLEKGLHEITLGPVSDKIVFDSIRLQAEEYKVLEVTLTSPSSLTLRLKALTSASGIVKIGYLTDGLDWSPNYQMELDPNSEYINLSAWATIENNTGTDFSATCLTLSTEIFFPQEFSEPVPPETPSDTFSLIAPRTSLNYHLPDPISLISQEKKRIPLFFVPKIPLTRRLFFDGDKYGNEVREEFVFINDSKDVPQGILPPGNVYIYQTTGQGRTVYVGKDSLPEVHPGQTAIIYMFPCPYIQADRVQTSYRKELTGTEYSYRSIFYNHSYLPVTIEVVEHLYDQGKLVESEPSPYLQRDDLLLYEITVPARDKRQIQYQAVSSNL